MQPTVKFLRIIYDPGSGAITIDLDDGLLSDGGEAQTPFGASQIAMDGTRETVFFRSEEMRRLFMQWGHKFLVGDSLKPPGSIMMQLKKFLEDHANKGKPFELLVDRFAGARFEFDGDLLDENGNAATYTPGAASYAASVFDRALTIAAADHVEIPRVPATNAPRLIPGEGLILVVFKPTWAGNDGVLHVLLDCGGAATNRLTLWKTVANDLELRILDNAGGEKKVSGAVSWTAGTWQAIVGIYASDGTLRLFLNEVKFGTVSGAGTGILNSLEATVFLASDRAGANRAAGAYERVALFTKAYAMSSSLAAVLKKAVVQDRNYFSKAELLPPLQIARPDPTVAVFQAVLSVRQGV